MKRSGSKKKEAKTIRFKSHKDMPICAISLSSSRVNKTGVWRSIKPIVLENKCTSCGLCWKFCPEPAITMEKDMPSIDYEYCKGCGICIDVCPSKAIVFAEEEK
jgi:2-oxoisovalerate ferredoxin oxidoreductase delta subunit